MYCCPAIDCICSRFNLQINASRLSCDFNQKYKKMHIIKSLRKHNLLNAIRYTKTV